ncbi:hypothetical protein GCM10023178_77240 [Actinomadura luteofluorescens]
MSGADRGVWGVAPPQETPSEAKWLVADVGGTNARFALVEGPDGALSEVRALPTRDHRGLAEAAAAYLDAVGVRPVAACLAVAGPVTNGTFHLTNAGWPRSAPEAVRAHLGLAHLDVINDFEALALALPRLGADDLVSIGRGRPDPGAPLAVAPASTPTSARSGRC